MTFKGTLALSQRDLFQKTMALHHSGQTDEAIAARLGITCSTVRYITSLLLTSHHQTQRDQQPRVAYELRLAGRSFTEISRMLNISRARAHQLVHKYEWGLRRLRSDGLREH